MALAYFSRLTVDGNKIKQRKFSGGSSESEYVPSIRTNGEIPLFSTSSRTMSTDFPFFYFRFEIEFFSTLKHVER